MIIADNDNQDIYRWLCNTLAMKVASTLTMGVVDEKNDLVAAIAYFKKGQVCWITAAAKNGSWCKPQTLSELLRIPFELLKCKIAKFETSHKNKKANRFCKGIGCVREGLLRYERTDGTHNVIWSLTLKEISKKGWYRKNGFKQS